MSGETVWNAGDREPKIWRIASMIDSTELVSIVTEKRASKFSKREA